MWPTGAQSSLGVLGPGPTFTSESARSSARFWGYDARHSRMGKIIVTGNDQRREYELGAVNTLGRHPDNTLQILDRIVSKEHAQIIKQPDGRFLFRDLGSLNGSFLRGERMSEHVLTDGDEITLGSTRLTYQDRSAEDSLLQKVTIAPSVTESLIRQKVQPPSGHDFLPE